MIMKFLEAGENTAKISNKLSMSRSIMKPAYKKKNLLPGPSPVVSKLNEKAIEVVVLKNPD